MRKAILFLHGTYTSAEISTYISWCRGRFCVAVDGGYSFFRKSKRVADLLIGDFDSLRKFPKNMDPRTEIVRAEVRKDATDSELALRLCIDRGCSDILIVQPSRGDADHMLGNIFLLKLGAKLLRGVKGASLRLVSAREEIVYLRDSRRRIRNARGDGISLIPVSARVVYSCKGTDYVAREVRLEAGQTLGLRNRITSQRAEFEVCGEAFLVRVSPDKKFLQLA